MNNNTKKIVTAFLFFLAFLVQSVYPALSLKNNVGVGPFAFKSTGFFGVRDLSIFMGAASSATNIGKNALTKIYVDNGDGTEPDSLKLLQMADEKAWVNFFKTKKDEKGNDVSVAPKNEDKVNNPIYDSKFTDLALLSGTPIVVLATDATLGDTQKIAVVSSADSVATNTEKLNDASGTAGNGIAAISASSDLILAAVKPSGGEFGAANSGFSLLRTDSGQVVTLNAQTGHQPGNLPVKLDLSADQLVAMSAAAEVDSLVDMYYSGKFFIGLRLHRSSILSSGGVVAALVGKVDNSDKKNPYKLILEPVVALDRTFFDDNDYTYGIGYFSTTAADDKYASIYKIRALQTSTSKNYLIFNGGVGDEATNVKNKIFALPATADGKLSKKDFSGEIDGASQLTKVTDTAAKIGQGDLPCDIKDVFVFGDAVYVLLSGNDDGTYNPEYQGIFYSAAILDVDGKIEKWTPWSRVMGSMDKALGGVIDPYYGNFMYLTLDASTTETDTVKLTQWGKGAKDGLLGGTDTDESLGLVSLLDTEFVSDRYGVNQLRQFDKTTPSFHQSSPDLISLAIATGYNKVALIQTGNGSSYGFISTTGDFANNTLKSTDGSAQNGAAGKKVMIISGGDLDNLGGIFAADISRTSVGNTGWVFVASSNGVAVLRDSDGNGWDAATGLKKGFVGISDTMSFKQLGDFTNVRQIVCDDTNLYILTIDKLYRIALNADNFSDANVENPTIVTLKTARTNEVFIDFMVSSKLGLLGTSNGLFRVGNGKDITVNTEPNLDWTEVEISYNTVNYSFPPVVHFAALSQIQKDFSKGGNLYVLTADYSWNLADVYRLHIGDTSGSAIDGDTVSFITESGTFLQYFSLGEYRSHIHTDGSVFFNQLSKHFGQTNFLRLSSNRANLSSSSPHGYNIDLGLTGGLRTGVVSRNFGSGAWMIPSNVGIRVNE